eukprot:m.143623 g.143623  ORF g.143623 m.143623 type:complete len:1019 (-) comp30326_c1_seq3:22-3078(-)
MAPPPASNRSTLSRKISNERHSDGGKDGGRVPEQLLSVDYDTSVWDDLTLNIANIHAGLSEARQMRVLTFVSPFFFLGLTLIAVLGVVGTSNPTYGFPVLVFGTLVFSSVGDLDIEYYLLKMPNFEFTMASSNAICVCITYFLMFRKLTPSGFALFAECLWAMLIPIVTIMFQLTRERVYGNRPVSIVRSTNRESNHTGRLGMVDVASRMNFLGWFGMSVLTFRLWRLPHTDDTKEIWDTYLFPTAAVLPNAINYAIAAFTQLYIFARGTAAHEDKQRVFVQLLCVSGSSIAIVWICAGVFKLVDPKSTSQAEGRSMTSPWFDLTLGPMILLAYPLVYLKRNAVWGAFSYLFDRSERTSAAKTLGELFAPTIPTKKYVRHSNVPSCVAVRLAQNRSSSQSSHGHHLPKTQLHFGFDLEPAPKAVQNWWTPDHAVLYGSTNYFVVASPTVDVHAALSQFLERAPLGQRGSSPSFWIYQCMTSMSGVDTIEVVTHLPVAAAACKKCLVLLDEDLVKDQCALLQLLVAMVVHTDIEFLPCGKYSTIFSSVLDNDLFDWTPAVTKTPTIPTTPNSTPTTSTPTTTTHTDTTATTTLSDLDLQQGYIPALASTTNTTITKLNSDMNELFELVVSRMGSANESAAIVQHLRHLVIDARKKVRAATAEFNFTEIIDVLVERNLIDGSPFNQEGTPSLLELVRIPKELPRTTIKLLERIGQGNFGEVRKALYNPEDETTPEFEVAVKVSRVGQRGGLDDDLMTEAIVSAQLVHVNVVALVGVVTAGEPVCLVLQMCSRGSLLSVLTEMRDDTAFAATEPVLTEISTWLLGVAEGMKYLASRKFVHRDLACRNVLVDAASVPKISDFGLSRKIDEGNEYYKMASEQALPLRWVAFEIFTAEAGAKFTEMSDVWSFGIVCIEAFQLGEVPYENYAIKYIHDLVIGGYVHPKPPLCPEWVYNEVVVRCLLPEPADRLGFEDICNIFVSKGLGKQSQSPSPSSGEPKLAPVINHYEHQKHHLQQPPQQQQ